MKLALNSHHVRESSSSPQECFALHRADCRTESEWHAHSVGMNLQKEAKKVCILSNLVLVLF